MRNFVPCCLRATLLFMLLSIGTVGRGQALSMASPPPGLAPADPGQSEKGELLETALNRIKQQHRITFGYDETLIQEKRVTASVSSDQPVEEQLRQLLRPFGLQHKQLDASHYVIQPKRPPLRGLRKLEKRSLDNRARQDSPQKLVASSFRGLRPPVFRSPVDKTITGQITDLENGESLPGVNVLVKNTTIGTVTDIDGNYSLSVPDDATTLVFSSVGYTSEEVAIGNQTVVDVGLAPDIQSLSEIVVVGYGTQKKSDLTGSVSSIPSEEISAYPVEGAAQALQGRAAGVQVQSTNGEPGSNPKVRIRGSTSIGASSDPLYVVDGFVGGILPPPEDIASIEVLKDASATAIYGSRGANGVIMVTTKRGKEGPPRFSLNTSYSFQEEINRLDLLNRDQYIDYVTEVNPDYIPGEGNTDWQDVIFRPGNIQNYQLSVSGGNENVDYYVSGIYFDQKGVILNSDFNRVSVISNINIKASDRFRLGLNLLARRRNRDGVRTQENSGGANGSGVVSAAFKAGPDLRILNDDGSFTLSRLGDPHDNPFAIATERVNQVEQDRVQLSAYGEYDLLEGLTLRTSIGASTRNERTGQYVPTTLQEGRGVNGRGSIRGDKSSNLLSETYLTFDKTVGIHRFSAVGGYSYQVDQYENWRAQGQSFVTDAGLYRNLNTASEWLQPESFYNSWELSSFYGRINYTLADRYLFTVNGRYDGSSRLSEGNQWTFFPSGAVGWTVSEEGFLQDNEWLSFLKLRASYGITGNQAVDPYETLAIFDPRLSIVNSEPANAVSPERVASPDLTWEETTQLNVGADFGFFEDRITATFDWYRMETNKLIFNRELPEIVGLSNPTQVINLGATENRGIEFMINSRNITGPFTWDMGINFTRNRNKVLELPDGNDIFYAVFPGHMVGINQTHLLREGEPVGLFYGWIYDGVYQEGDEMITDDGPQPGDEKFRDIDGRDEAGNLTGQPDGQINSDDRTVIGNPQPDFIWGLNNTFKWKGFDLNVFFQASQGNDLLSYTLMELDLMAGLNNATVAALDRWTPTNTDTDVPRAAARDRRVSSRWVRDGSYVRLKNLALGYNFPSSLLDRISLEQLRIYVSAQNILTFTDYEGYDPEVNYRSNPDNPGVSDADSNRNLGIDYGSYPNVKAYTVGLNITF